VSTALVLPYFVYRGEVLRADRGALGARMLRTDRYEFDIGFSAALGASSGDVKAREGMPDLGVLVEFGPRMKINLAQPSASSRVRFELPLRSVLELRGGVHGRGTTLEPELVYEDRPEGPRWRIQAGVSALWGDRKLNNFLYGVAPEFATSARPAFDARAGLIAMRATLTVSYPLGPDLRVYALGRVDNTSGAANRASPLHLSSQGATFGVGLAWTLARSSRSVAD
jgi:outer membrane scaffolding protein for murein synthesis (MipA/OmpV family)